MSVRSFYFGRWCAFELQCAQERMSRVMEGAWPYSSVELGPCVDDCLCPAAVCAFVSSLVGLGFICVVWMGYSVV